MSNIDSRYTIEYVSENSESKSVSSSAIKVFMVIILLIVAIAVFGFSFLKGGYLDQYRQNIPFLSSSSPPLEIEPLVEEEEPEIEDALLDQSEEVTDLTEQKEEVMVPVQKKMPMIASSVEINETKPVIKPITDTSLVDEKTKSLEKKIEELTIQLSSEKKKNNDLIERINKNKAFNKNIAAIYNEVTEDDVSVEDDGFLKILEKEFTRQNSITESLKRPDNDIETPQKVIASTKAVKNFAISQSAMSQMNKIIFAMGGGINRGMEKKLSTKPRLGIQENLVVNKMVVLQGAVDKLLDPADLPDTKFMKALHKEGVLRKNAVRMIVVKKGETLWGIAKRAYGDGNRYSIILKANPELKRGKVVLLSIGQILRVPI